MLDLRAAAPRTAMLIVLYAHQTRRELYDPRTNIGEPWRNNILRSRLQMTRIISSISEQHLLLRLLSSNAQRIPPSFKPARSVYETQFRASFLLPMGPLEPSEKGSLSIDACAVCYHKAEYQCPACQSVRYCSEGAPDFLCSLMLKQHIFIDVFPAFALIEHQFQHWRDDHKQFCKNRSRISWVSLPIAPTSEEPRFNETNIRIANIDTHAPLHLNALEAHDPTATGPPANTHASAPFIAKIQLDNRTRATLMIYDQYRTFEAWTFLHTCGKDFWERLEGIIRRRGTLGGVKLFVWLKRKGDWEFSIALDEFPDQAIAW